MALEGSIRKLSREAREARKSKYKIKTIISEGDAQMRCWVLVDVSESHFRPIVDCFLDVAKSDSRDDSQVDHDDRQNEGLNETRDGEHGNDDLASNRRLPPEVDEPNDPVNDSEKEHFLSLVLVFFHSNSA